MKEDTCRKDNQHKGAVCVVNSSFSYRTTYERSVPGQDLLRLGGWGMGVIQERIEWVVFKTRNKR